MLPDRTRSIRPHRPALMFVSALYKTVNALYKTSDPNGTARTRIIVIVATAASGCLERTGCLLTRRQWQPARQDVPKDARLGGGVHIICQYLQAGLIDEMHLATSACITVLSSCRWTRPQCHRTRFSGTSIRDPHWARPDRDDGSIRILDFGDGAVVSDGGCAGL